ncbi:MAG: hypothetical protein EBU90_01370 [Proteobacteria bacterium]|nr:hypothetical protein [Pseudomonadota bacterium]NBP12810.1 hypothetical protein [bacterium]
MNTTAITITGSGKIAAVIQGKAYTIAPDHPNYDKIIDAVKAQDWNKFVSLADVATAITQYAGSRGVKIVAGCVVYNGETIHNTITDRIVKFMREGLPFEPLVKFLENLMQNPSKRAVDELYGFLEAGELPITTDGCFLAYKNVRSDYRDIHSGKFDNSIGKTCEMPRNQVCDDKDLTCSSGLHFCSIKYLPHFRDSDGGKTIILKINPADVVSIPSDYNNTKGRTCKYEVVADYTDDWRSKLDRGESGWDSDLYDEDGSEYEDEDEGLGCCEACHEDLTNDNFNGNDDELCDGCLDSLNPNGCDENHCFCDKTDEHGDIACDLDAPSNSSYGFKPDGSKFHNVRDEKGRFVKNELERSIIKKFVKKLKKMAKEL